MDALIQRLRSTIEIMSKSHGHVYQGDGAPWKFCMHPPTNESEVEAVETQFGFHLPLLLRRIYLEVGNGRY